MVNIDKLFKYVYTFLINIKGGVNMSSNSEIQKSSLCTAGLVLGCIGLCTAFIPVVNNLSFFMGIFAVIFSLASIKKARKSKVIITAMLGILAIIITLSIQKNISDSLDTLSKNLNKATGESTEQVLANDVDVVIGKFEATTDEYGLNTTKLTVKITNKTAETKSFTIQVEAVDADGNRINQDYVYANNLTAGQSQEFEIFNFVSSDQIDAMKDAKFNIVEASVY